MGAGPDAYETRTQHAAQRLIAAGSFMLQTQDTSSPCGFSNCYLPNPACDPQRHAVYANNSASVACNTGGLIKKPTRATRPSRHGGMLARDFSE